jgi:hypothetical protein
MSSDWSARRLAGAQKCPILTAKDAGFVVFVMQLCAADFLEGFHRGTDIGSLGAKEGIEPEDILCLI